MKQQISPKMFVVIIAVAVVLLVGGVWWTWKAPSASAASSTTAFHPHPGGAREQAEAMRAERMGRGQGQAASPQNATR